MLEVIFIMAIPEIFLLASESFINKNLKSNEIIQYPRDNKQDSTNSEYKHCIPRDYRFVVIKINSRTTENIYYTNDGESIRIVYKNGEWYETSNIPFSSLICLLFPTIGGLLFCLSLLHQISRTGECCVA